MQTSHRRTIATRKLCYTYSGELAKQRVNISISEPFYLTEGSVDFAFSEGTAGCVISFDGLDEKEMTVYGADTIQALAIAVDALEKYLHRLSRKYDFYFETGEPYFED